MMNEKSLIEIDCDTEESCENAKIAEEDVKIITEGEAENAEDTESENELENAELDYENIGLDYENAELTDEDAEGRNLAIGDEEVFAENLKSDELAELKSYFPALADLKSTAELQYPERYEKFRALGLTPKEAFLATGQALRQKRHVPSSPISVSRQRDGIPGRDLKYAREIFTDLCDREIQELYKKVAK